MGDYLLPFVYPEKLKMPFPDMFRQMSMITVKVRLGQHGSVDRIDGVYGKITALIRYRGSAHLRVGSLLFNCTERRRRRPDQDGFLRLERSNVTVPSDCLLSIKTDLYIKIDSTDQRHREHIFDFENNHGNQTIPLDDNISIDVEVNVSLAGEGCPQLGRPVEVVKGDPQHPSPTVVYTVGDDVMSFIEFIRTLRRIVADHPRRQDILDSHDLLNLSSTQEHPVLPEQRDAEQPQRWVHIRLQAVEQGQIMSWTTLFMRGDNLYVTGFMNQHGVYALVDNRCTAMVLPNQYMGAAADTRRLNWSTVYRKILGASKWIAVDRLVGAHLGRNFLLNAVPTLSRYRIGAPVEDENEARLALAGLIVMVCESARMNPIHDAIADGWTNGTGLSRQMILDYVWGYGEKSKKLLEWKRQNYEIPESLPHHPIKELQGIYLVLNTTLHRAQQKEKNNYNLSKKPIDHGGRNDGTDNNKWKTKEYSSYSSRQASNNESRDAYRRGGYGSSHCIQLNNRTRSEDNIDNSDQRQPKKSDHAGSSAGPAIKSKDTRSTVGGGGGSSASKPTWEAGDARAGSPSQPWGAGDATSGGVGSAGQPEGGGGGGGDPDPSGGNGGSQPAREADGRPRVELLALAMRADLRVHGTTIIVFDGKRGQIIYTHEQQEEDEPQQGMVNLNLTGPYTGISANGCFAIKIQIPDADPIKWEWDGYESEYAAEVDGPPVICRNIDNIAEVTYAVMSNALEASVEVMLQLKDGHILGADNGKITALIDGFEVSSVLFSRTQGTGQCFSYTADSSRLLLQLDRNLVVVPCGRVLHIGVDLPIKTSMGFSNRLKADDLVFENGYSTKSYEDGDGNKVEVNITWYPEINIEQIALQEKGDIGVPTDVSPTQTSQLSEVNVIEKICDQ